MNGRMAKALRKGAHAVAVSIVVAPNGPPYAGKPGFKQFARRLYKRIKRLYSRGYT